MEEVIAKRIVTWMPPVLFGTFLATLALTMYTSIRLSEGSPCGEWLCDISVYAAWPEHDLEEVIFRVGFSLMAFECLVLALGRTTMTGNWTPLPLYVLTLICLLLMAFIPCYSSGVHFASAGGIFLFLSIAEVMDTRADANANSTLTRVRYAIICTTGGSFGIWLLLELFLGLSMPILEFFASIVAFSYFLTFSYQLLAHAQPKAPVYPLIRVIP